ncbi:hypothetical protein [Caulobacter sp. 17J80-11]|uniref:hypothetical protein n=1 Tax=Caulobacter sp. 17J80-11 TaxID=2763502 RepID=UPI0016536465|nr:hypothetical protein [Caulobacter sp. 17J80-11]MBC6980900.1 hypothetical protein [Caulobacter sp. 17J80-11]
MRVPLFALVAAIAATPAVAAETVGRADLSYSAVRWEWDGWPVDNTDVALSGAAATTFANGWGVQVDGRSDSYAWGGEDGRDSVGFAAVHGFKRLGRYTVGAFAGATTFYGADGALAGVEAQAELSKAMVSVSAAKAEFDGYSSSYGLWDTQVSGRWYLTDNLALGAAAGYVDWDGARREITGWNAGVDAEYKPFETVPVSLFAAARRDRNDFPRYEYGSDTLTVGVRLNFGAATVRERDRKGVSLTGAQALGDHLLHY